MRWGFLGASRIGASRLAQAIHQAGGQLTAVAARDPLRAAHYASQNGFERAEPSYEALLNAKDIDAIYLSLTNDQHVPWTLRALEAGKHVLCEKPLAMNADEVSQLIGAQQNHPASQVMEAFVHPFHPQFDFVRGLIQRGDAGEIRGGHAEFLASLDRADDYRWERDKGGGALLDVGCYAVSAIRLLTGYVPQNVSASAQWRGDVDGSLNALLEAATFSATLNCSLQALFRQRLELWSETCSITFQRPFSAIEETTTVWVNQTAYDFPPCNPYTEMVRAFQQACQIGQPVPLPLADSLIQSRTLDALLQSAETGKKVSL